MKIDQSAHQTAQVPGFFCVPFTARQPGHLNKHIAVLNTEYYAVSLYQTVKKKSIHLFIFNKQSVITIGFQKVVLFSHLAPVMATRGLLEKRVNLH